MLYFFLCVLLSPLLATSIDVEVSSGGAPTTTPLSSSSSTLSTNDIQVLRKLEKLALINLYTATKGAMWRDNQNWLQGDPCMQSWYGVQCNELLLVDSIKLAANRLNGTIPDVFSDLSQVKDLDLSLNYLKGPLPASMSQLILLKNLDIGYNYLLISLRTFEHFKHLEMLTLRWNTLITGSLRDLQHCTSLHTINFRDNTMESLTLDGIEQLTALLHVDLTKSGLRGVLHIRHLHGLVSFNAANNYLSGSIAKTIEEGLTSTTISTTQYNLSLLEELDLSNNMLTGPVPLLASAVQLQRLDLSNNEFVSSHLTLSDHLHLKELLLSGNRLEQHFPYDLYKLSQLEIFECSNCELFGVIGMPMGSLPALERFIVHNNRLVGQLPRAIWNMPQLTRLDVSHNQLVGRIHTAIKNAGNLEILRLSSNRFTGTIPQEMSFCLDLQEVRLEHNQFNGALPNIFVNEMNDLHTFSVHNNYLTSIPQTLLPRIQVWPLGLRPAATVSTGRSVSLVVYHNNIPSGNVGSHDGGDSSSTSTDTTTAVSSLPANHIAKDVPMFRVCGTMNDFYANTLLNAGWLRTDTERYHASYGLCWEENKPKDPKRILSIQRVSRFPDVGQVSDKGLLTNNIEIMRRKFPKEYSFYPTSFTIPNQLPEYIQEFNSVQATLQNNDENLWLMKPRARCCGEGIRIISNATASIDLVDPDLGEWYVQKFVSPPALIDGHKFVFRLFAVVTSFSPLRVQLYHDGLIFYTFTNYDVSNQTAKRSYISDYFFTERQSDYYVLVQDYLESMSNYTHYKTSTGGRGSSSGGSSSSSSSGNSGGSDSGHIPKSQQGGPIHVEKVWKDIKAVVVKSLIATLRWTTKMQNANVIDGTTYEIFGYDIVLDHELNPFLCEINETPNMGLEVNYHSDYHGLGEMIEKMDYQYKTDLMKHTLEVADVEPRYTISELDHIRSDILEVVNTHNLACVLDDHNIKEDDTKGDGGAGGAGGDGSECLNNADLLILIKLESELRRSDGNEYEQVFPCVECSQYFQLMKVRGLEWNDVLNVWWVRQREIIRASNGLTHRYENTQKVPTLEPWVSFLLRFVEEEEEE